MNLFQPILIAAACVLALSACASAPPAQRTRAPAAVFKAPPPAAANSMILPAAAEVAVFGAANTGGTYPYGTIQGGTIQGGTIQGGTIQGGTAQIAAQKTTQGFAIKVPQQAPRQAPQQAKTETTEGVVVMGPDGTFWLRAGGENAAYRGDVDSCYAYARGQVAHDVRIESDVASAFDSDSDGFGLAALRGRMNDFERRNRVPALFRTCMSAKGYNRQ